jgi:hypothetical protein
MAAWFEALICLLDCGAITTRILFYVVNSF